MVTGVPIKLIIVKENSRTGESYTYYLKNAPNTPEFKLNPGSSKSFVVEVQYELPKYSKEKNFAIIEDDNWVDINSGLGYSGTKKDGRVEANQYLEGQRLMFVGPHKSVDHSAIHHNKNVWDYTLPFLQ